MTDGSFVELIEQVRLAVEGIGLPWKGRFEAYETAARTLNGHDAGRIEAYFDENGHEVLFEGLSQLWQLALAACAWEYLDRERLRRKLKLVLGGPSLPPRDSVDDHSRNTLLELAAASIALDYGFEVAITDSEEDVIATKAAVGMIDLECKRPASIRGLRRNLERLREQIARTPCSVAMPVVGADRIVGLPAGPYEAQDEHSFLDTLDRTIATVISEVQRLGVAHRSCRLGPKAPVGAVLTAGAVFLRKSGTTYHFVRWNLFDLEPRDQIAASNIRGTFGRLSGRLAEFLGLHRAAPPTESGLHGGKGVTP